MEKINLTEDVLVQIIDEQAVIVSPSGGIITTVNETGAFIIELLKENRTISLTKLIREVQNEFDAPENVITNDVTAFIKEILDSKIIEEI